MGGESITATRGGFMGGESVAATRGGFMGGESVAATRGGFIGGESVAATRGGFIGGESVAATRGGFIGGESVIAKAELAIAQPATKAIRLTFMLFTPSKLLMNAGMRDPGIRFPALVKATQPREFPHVAVTMYA
jgi:hypothetical protein